MIAAKENQNYETLGNGVMPLKYTINFRPDLKTFKYAAHEKIDASVKKATRSIALNAAELKINSAGILSKGLKQKASARYDEKKQRIILNFAKPVSGDVEIEID